MTDMEDPTIPALYLDNVSVTTIPEPGTFLLLLIGLGMLASVVSRKNKTIRRLPV